MKSEVMSRFTEIWLPSTALIIFISIFVIMLVYILKKTSGERFEMVAKLPLEEEIKDER